MGCNRGTDPEVVHIGTAVAIRSVGKEEIISLAEWRNSVFVFVDQIRHFYDEATPKLIPDDPEGWTAFWDEWRSRRATKKS
jgi:hypothetical protein